MHMVQHDISNGTLSLTSAPLPTAEFSKEQHLIKVLAVSPCAGELSWPRPAKFTVSVPGVDAVGIVVASPPSSTIKPGSRVYYRTQYPNPASLRQYSIATTAELALAPSNLSAVDVAAIPVSALTAYQGLFDQFRLPNLLSSSSPISITNPTRILINGASGACGQWVVQLAVACSLTTIATHSSKSADLVRSLGAHELLDYTTTSPAAYVSANPDRAVDLIFDCVGQHTHASLWPALKPHGKLLTIVPPPNMDFSFVPKASDEQIAVGEVAEGVTGKFFTMHPDGKQLSVITKLVEEGKCKPFVDSVFEMEQYKEAFERVDSGKCSGKVVIKVAEDEGAKL